MSSSHLIRVARPWCVRAAASLALVAALSACGETQGDRVAFDVRARGGAPNFSSGAWQVTLDVAQLGVGPLYLCSSATPDIDLCDVAVAQILETRTVDALSSDSQPLGVGQGVTGTVRSALFDYGITWLFTRPKPLANEGAPQGVSAVISGQATRGAESFAWSAKLSVVASRAGDPAVRATVPEQKLDTDVASLTLQLKPEAWFSAVDFDDLAEVASGGSVEIAEGSQAHNALVQALTSTALPEFSWE